MRPFRCLIGHDPYMTYDIAFLGDSPPSRSALTEMLTLAGEIMRDGTPSRHYCKRCGKDIAPGHGNYVFNTGKEVVMSQYCDMPARERTMLADALSRITTTVSIRSYLESDAEQP